MMATTYKGSWIPIYNVRLPKHHHFDKLKSTLGELERNEEYRLKPHSLFCRRSAEVHVFRNFTISQKSVRLIDLQVNCFFFNNIFSFLNYEIIK